MNVHATSDLQTYPLPPALLAHLRMVDRHAQNAARLGQPVEAIIVLSAHDYATVDEVVRVVSGGRFHAGSVTWNGRPLRRCAAAIAA